LIEKIASVDHQGFGFVGDGKGVLRFFGSNCKFAIDNLQLAIHSPLRTPARKHAGAFLFAW
jgi:hypothetical protein